MTRKLRSDSHATEGAFMRAPTPEPPEHVNLPDAALPFWHSIVTAKAPDSWTAVDLEQAAELARCKADLERLRREIAEEGDIVDGKVSERRKLEAQLVWRSIQLTRLLQIHALATQGRSGDQGKRNAKARDMSALGFEEGGLIPGPPDGGRH